MNPFARLGLSEDADEAQIKRAYARELRGARPDQDPQAFQQLREAYAQCLQWLRARTDPARAQRDSGIEPGDAFMPAFTIDSPAGDMPMPPRETAAVPPRLRRSERPVQNDFDPIEFLSAFDQAAIALPAKLLHEWLLNAPALYSLAHKRAVATVLIEHLLQRQPALRVLQLTTTLRFFGLDTVHEHSEARDESIEALYIFARERGYDVQVPDSYRPSDSRKTWRRWVERAQYWGSLAILVIMALTMVATVYQWVRAL